MPTYSIFHTFSSSIRSVSRNYNTKGAAPVTYSLPPCFCICELACASIILRVIRACVCGLHLQRECQTLRHGSGLILMQAHGVELRLGDNCCSEERMAWELSSCSSASHRAVHHTGLMTDILCGETKAISSACAQLMHRRTELT